MELRDYFKVIGKYLTILMLIMVVGGVAALFWTKSRPKSYLASTTITINRASTFTQKDVSFYIYDNYYNIQSAGLFGQIVATWFDAPSLVKEIYEKAGVTMPNVSQKKLAKTFKAVSNQPAPTINVSLSGTNKDDIEKLINSAATVIQEKTNEMGRTGDSFYEINKFTPIITDNSPNIALNTIAGLVVGLFAGLMVIFAIEYFREEKK